MMGYLPWLNSMLYSLTFRNVIQCNKLKLYSLTASVIPFECELKYATAGPWFSKKVYP